MAYRRKKVYVSEYKMQKMQKRLALIAVAAALLFLFFNKDGRQIINAYFAEKSLAIKIKEAQKENEALLDKLRLLENNPSYFEKIVRKKLRVIGEGEIEYRFSIKN